MTETTEVEAAPVEKVTDRAVLETLSRDEVIAQAQMRAIPVTADTPGLHTDGLVALIVSIDATADANPGANLPPVDLEYALNYAATRPTGIEEERGFIGGGSEVVDTTDHTLAGVLAQEGGAANAESGAGANPQADADSAPVTTDTSLSE